MMPVLSLNVGVSGVKPGNRRLHAVPTTHNVFLPLGGKQSVSTAVTATARSKYVACLDDDDETGCGAL